jgi:hypothetical protein
MKLDWCKDSGKWNIWDLKSNTLLAKAESVDLLVPSTLISTDGGRHGYLIANGELTVSENNHATIRRK